MIEYIKRPYESPIAGVTNVATGWKITSDAEGLNILEEVGPSEANVNRYYSNLALPVDTIVYIWYRMILSNGEDKGYVGPKEYVSRSSNITNDIKPLTRIETPEIILDEDSVKSGSNIISVKSSKFRGDRLDGHYSSTWYIKAPDGRLIHKVLNSTINKYSLNINKSLLALGDLDYIVVGLKHHGANGTPSDFAKLKIELTLYPFKFVGSSSIDPSKEFRFAIEPYNASRPNLKMVRVVNALSGEEYIRFDDVSVLDFTIPPYIIPEDIEVRIESYVLETVVGDRTYPLKLDTNLTALKMPDRLVFNDNAEYNLNSVESVSINTPETKGVYYLVSGETYVLSKDGMDIHRFSLDRTIGRFNTTKLDIDSRVVAFMSSDSKLLHLRNGRLILVSRKGTTISFIHLQVFGNTVIPNDRLAVRSINCRDVNQNLENVVCLDLSDSRVYVFAINTLNVTFNCLDIRTNTLTTLSNRPSLSTDTYKPEIMLLNVSDYGRLTSIGGFDGSDIVYEYVAKEDIWISRELVGTSMIDNMIESNSVLLSNKNVLLLGTTNSDGGAFIILPNSKIIEKLSTVVLPQQSTAIVDSTGVLYLFSKTSESMSVIGLV